MRKTVLAAAAVLFAVAPVAAQEVERSRTILPIAGSAPGAFNSHFKTELQINNRSAQPMTGTIVFHPIGVSAAAEDPFVRYELAPHQTIAYGDVVGMFNVEGLGTVEIISDRKGLPTAVARAYDDRGAIEGTKGTVIPPVRPDEALQSGESASLIVPMDLERYRFNVGIRSMEDGAALHVAIHGANGIERKAIDLVYPPNYLVQLPANALVNDTLLANETLVFRVDGGAAILYGTTTDNTTNDPSIQMAMRPEAAAP